MFAFYGCLLSSHSVLKLYQLSFPYFHPKIFIYQQKSFSFGEKKTPVCCLAKLLAPFHFSQQFYPGIIWLRKSGFLKIVLFILFGLGVFFCQKHNFLVNCFLIFRLGISQWRRMLGDWADPVTSGKILMTSTPAPSINSCLTQQLDQGRLSWTLFDFGQHRNSILPAMAGGLVRRGTHATISR